MDNVSEVRSYLRPILQQVGVSVQNVIDTDVDLWFHYQRSVSVLVYVEVNLWCFYITGLAEVLPRRL